MLPGAKTSKVYGLRQRQRLRLEDATLYSESVCSLERQNEDFDIVKSKEMENTAKIYFRKTAEGNVVSAKKV